MKSHPDDDLPTSPFIAHSAAATRLTELPAGWDAATAWRRLQGNLPEGPLRQEVRERAIRAVIERAKDLLRHAARPMRRERVGWPAEGDLDLEETLERPRPWSAEDLRVERRVAREADVVAVLDMSLSMTGEKIALVAVATAILTMKLEHVAVVAFDTVPHLLVRSGERLPLREVVRRVLEVPAQGYTNIEGGLLSGFEQLRRGRHRERVGLLFTDGVANVGWDPVRAAHRYPRLHVVHVGEHHPQGARTCLAMARAGRGKLYRARAYQDLPGVVRTAVRELFRG
jgi:Mg-chelatase subunit ChlD